VSGRPEPPAGLLDYFDTIGCPPSAVAGVPQGVAQYTRDMTYNDPDQLETILQEEGNDVACIILEPVYLALPENGYLERLRELADEYGVVLIFDEVKTGCRVAPGGAQEYFGVTPDLSVYSKAMSNGYPFSVVAGAREIMRVNEGIWYAGTNSGNLVGVAAALATAKEIQRAAFREHVWRLGRKLMTGLDKIAADVGIEARCGGLPPMPALRFAPTDQLSANAMETRFLCECISRGVFFPKNHCWFISYQHTDAEIDRTLEVCEAALRAVKSGL